MAAIPADSGRLEKGFGVSEVTLSADENLIERPGWWPKHVTRRSMSLFGNGWSNTWLSLEGAAVDALTAPANIGGLEDT